MWTPAAGTLPTPLAPAIREHIDLWLLPEGEVHWFSDELDGLRLLSGEECERMNRKRTEPARTRFLGARLLCRYALSARSGVPLDRWAFRAGPYGRPEPDPGESGIRFNLSHTDGLIACVVTRDLDCGVDVERTPARDEAVRWIPRFLAADERAQLDALAEPKRPVRLAEYWVLKEAYLKALGVGMHRALSGFTFRLPADPIGVDDPERAAAGPESWRFHLLYPDTEHVLALAVRGSEAAGLGAGLRLHRLHSAEAGALNLPAVPAR